MPPPSSAWRTSGGHSTRPSQTQALSSRVRSLFSGCLAPALLVSLSSGTPGWLIDWFWPASLPPNSHSYLFKFLLPQVSIIPSLHHPTLGSLLLSSLSRQTPHHLSCSDLGRAQNAGPTESVPLRTTRVPEPERLGPGRCMQPRAGL